MVSRLDLTRETRTATITLYTATTRSIIPVSVTLNKADSRANQFMVGASTRGTTQYSRTNTVELTVDAGKPFFIYAWQYYFTTTVDRTWSQELLGVTRIDHPGSDYALKLDVDLSSKLTPTSFAGTMTLPTAPDNVVGQKGAPDCSVYKIGTSMPLGGCESTTAGAGGTFSHQGSYLRLAGETNVVTQYSAWTEFALGGGSHIYLQGYPTQSAKVSGFLDVPVLVHPPDTSTPVELHETIRFKNPDPGALVSLMIVAGRPARLWRVYARAGASSITVPRLPGGVSASEVFGPVGKISGRIEICGAYDATTGRCGKIATTPFFKVHAF